MAIRVVRLGTPRQDDEGLRLGTVRRPPRGVRKEDFGRRDYFDVWVPELAPSAPLVSWALSEPLTPKRWARFVRRYRAEMRKPAAQRLITLLAVLSAHRVFPWAATVPMSPSAIGRPCESCSVTLGPCSRIPIPDCDSTRLPW